MHKYLMEIEFYFRGAETFEITAENKADALIKATARINTDPYYHGNCKRDTLKCVKKMKK